MLPKTLRSIIDQSVSASRICILDNGSTDTTADVIKPFLLEGVEYVRNHVNNHLGAWSQIKHMARGSWLMVFHDDDLLHPDYVKVVLTLLEQYPTISLVGSGMKAVKEPDMSNWNITGNTDLIYCPNYSDLARLLFSGFSMPFCSAVYRTEVFKTLTLEIDTFGKVFDRPFMMEVSKNGGAAILTGKYVRARIHPDQDSKSISTGSYVSELISLNRYYYKALGQNVFNKSGRIFLLKSYSRLISAYEWLDLEGSGLTKSKFIDMAIEGGATTKKAIKIGSTYYLLFGWPLLLAKKLLKPFRN